MAELTGRELAVSWSRIRVHEDCKQHAYQLAQGKRSKTPDIRVYFHGTVVDRCMRHWLESPDPQPGQMAAMVPDIINAEVETARDTGDGVIRWRSLDDRQHMTEWCIELVTRLEPILLERIIPLDYQPARRFRVPFTVPYLDGTPQQITLLGEMDLLTRDKQGQFYIWDLKGTADNSYWKKVIAQLLFYDLAVGAEFGRFSVGGALIQPMCDERVLFFEFTAAHRAELAQHLINYCHDVWRGDHAPKAGTQGCDRCDVRHACVRYAVPSGSGRAALAV